MQLPNELLRASQHDCPAVEPGSVTRPQKAFSDLKVTLTSLRRAFAICEENRRLTAQSRYLLAKRGEPWRARHTEKSAST